jgi:hypothetical protein
MNFMITASDDDGTLSSIASRATSNLKPESYQQILAGGLRLRQEVDVPLRATSLRLGVQDALTGHMGNGRNPAAGESAARSRPKSDSRDA